MLLLLPWLPFVCQRPSLCCERIPTAILLPEGRGRSGRSPSSRLFPEHGDHVLVRVAVARLLADMRDDAIPLHTAGAEGSEDKVPEGVWPRGTRRSTRLSVPPSALPVVLVVAASAIATRLTRRTEPVAFRHHLELRAEAERVIRPGAAGPIAEEQPVALDPCLSDAPPCGVAAASAGVAGGRVVVVARGRRLWRGMPSASLPLHFRRRPSPPLHFP